MSYCPNPRCVRRHNPDEREFCQSCGTPLLVMDRYRLVEPLRSLDPRHSTELWNVDDGILPRVLKLIKDNQPKRIELLERESIALMSLDHPGIPKTEPEGHFAMELPDGEELHGLIMEKIEGIDLQRWVEQHGRISEATALDWLRQMAEILECVHENGFFHRDIKPANLVRKPNGQLVLIDFGSVRELDMTYLAKVGWAQDIAEIAGITAITSAGYSPPEQVEGKAVPQSDFFALGRTFVYLLAGCSPTQLPQDPKSGRLQWRDRAKHVSPVVADLIDDLMAPFPGGRPQTARALKERLTPSSLLVLKWVRRANSHRLKLSVAGATAIAGLGLFFGLRPYLASYLYTRGFQAFEQARMELPQPESDRRDRHLDTAEAFLDWTLRLQPNKGIAHYTLGDVCLEQQDWDCARSQFQQATRHRSVLAAPAFNNLGYIAIKQQDYETAQYYLARAWQHVNPESDDARNRGDVPSGLQGSEDLQYVESSILKNQGWALLEQGNPLKAEKKLERAIELRPNSAAAHCLLAQVRDKLQKSSTRQWEECVTYASPYLASEQGKWLDMGIERLRGDLESER